MASTYKAIFIGNESPYLDVLNKFTQLSLIVCKPLRGNGRKYFGSALRFARENRIPVSAPEVYMSNEVAADVIVVSGYPKRIPKGIIHSARIAAINIHQSLLPAYRGRHPLNWAIINGETLTGVTLHYLNERFDDGKIIKQESVKIEKNDTIMDVYQKTAKKGQKLLRNFCQEIGSKKILGRKQNLASATYFPPRTPKDGKINWQEPAEKIYNLVRALTFPYPGAYFYYKKKKLIIEECKPLKTGPIELKRGKPIFKNKCCIVKTGMGFLRILRVRNHKLSEIFK